MAVRFVDQSIQMFWPIQIALELDHELVFLVAQAIGSIVLVVAVDVVVDLS